MKTVSESAPETIEVGARVRFKGDHSPHPLWMTVTRRDVNPRGPDGQPIMGTFLQLMWPISSAHAPNCGVGVGSLDDVRAVQSVMEGAVTTKALGDGARIARVKHTPTKRRAR